LRNDLQPTLHYIFDITKNPHNNMDMKITAEVCISLFYWKINSIKIIAKVHVLWKWNLNNKIKFVVFYYEVSTTILTP
jgi:hypothetical protein